MTPYARSVLKFLSFSFVVGLIAQIYALYVKLPVPPALFWAGAAALALSGVAFAYYRSVGELHHVAGFYRPVRALRRDAKRSFEDLGVKKYVDYYLPRADDKIIRARLKDKGGVVVAGPPLSGKTRAAVEAIVAALPKAFLMRIDPANFTFDRIDALIVPCPFVFFRKPAVVVFFDNVDTLDAGLIDKLLSRLTEQTSAVFVASTCDDGPKEQRLEALRKSARGYLFEPARLERLTAEESGQILAGAWAGAVYPVISDVTLPGYIVLGSNPVLGKIRALPAPDRKVIQALRLAAGCGALDCDEGLFWSILDDVLAARPADRAAVLERFAREGMIVVRPARGSPKRISAQHTSYLDDAYDDLRSFNGDFARLVEWLSAKGDARRLAAAGSHYWDVLLDPTAARRVYEIVVELGEPDPSHHLKLAALYAAAGEGEREEDRLARALALVDAPPEKARLLISHGDVLLYRFARPADSIKVYNRAYDLIKNTGDEKLCDLVRRRSGDNLLVNRNYAEAEPYFRAWLSSATGDDALDACERVALCLIGQSRDVEAQTILHEAWTALSSAARIARAMQLLDDAEGSLIDERLTAAGRVALNCLMTPANAGADAKRRTDEIVDFGYHALCRGFVQASAMAHIHLTALPETELDKANQAAVRVNLGVAQCHLGEFTAARRTFEQAGAIAGSDARAAVFGAGAQAGLGDVCMREGKTADAKERYRRALRLAEETQDTNMINWAHLGLGEVALAEQDHGDAERYFVQIDRIVESYQEYLRIWLGLARVRIHMKQWAEAESFLSRGLSLRRRRDFAGQHLEFQKLRDALPKREPAEPARTV